MSRFENFLAYAEIHRISVCALAGIMVGIIAWADSMLPNLSIGFLYLIPILVSAAALNVFQIIVLAGLCSVLREAFDDPEWSSAAASRVLVVGAGYMMTGFFVVGLNQRRRLLRLHLDQLETEVRLRKDAESQIRIIIETSPLAILTIDQSGKVVLANESARVLLDLNGINPQGVEVAPYLPILPRMLLSHHRGGNIRTNVECKARRRNGEVFLASVWLSTYRTSSGPALAAVIWDASESLRDREGAGLDSMLATSRVLIGAMSHEIRNLASAASTSYGALASVDSLSLNEHYQALGSLIGALGSIASSGLHLAAHRETAVSDLGTVLDQTRIVIEPALREEDFEISWKVADNLPLVQADHHSLLQVFVNLARNIQQHGANGSERKACISAGVENDLVAVRFRDTGPGVDHPEELFRPFQPGAHSAGLGLYVSRAILRSHGGNLRYEPAAPGACFIVELWPVEKTQP